MSWTLATARKGPPAHISSRASRIRYGPERVWERSPRLGPIMSRLPGLFLQHVAFIDLHRIGNLAAHRFVSGGVKKAHDLLCESNVQRRERAGHGAMKLAPASCFATVRNSRPVMLSAPSEVGRR